MAKKKKGGALDTTLVTVGLLGGMYFVAINVVDLGSRRVDMVAPLLLPVGALATLGLVVLWHKIRDDL